MTGRTKPDTPATLGRRQRAPTLLGTLSFSPTLFRLNASRGVGDIWVGNIRPRNPAREYPGREYPGREYPAREYPGREYPTRIFPTLQEAVRQNKVSEQLRVPKRVGALCLLPSVAGVSGFVRPVVFSFHPI